MKNKLTVKEFSRYTNVSEHTIRYYVKINLLPSTIGDNGYHYFEEEQMDLLLQIEVLKKANLSLAEIKQIVATYDEELLLSSLKQAKQNLIKEKLILEQQIKSIDNQLDQNYLPNTLITRQEFKQSFKVIGEFKQDYFPSIKEEYTLIKNHSGKLSFDQINYLYEFDKEKLLILAPSKTGDVKIQGDFIWIEMYIDFDLELEQIKKDITRIISKSDYQVSTINKILVYPMDQTNIWTLKANKYFVKLCIIT